MKLFILSVLLGCFAVACSCESINSIEIESPAPGSFFAAGQDVEVLVTTKESPVYVNFRSPESVHARLLPASV